jgi:cell division protease FtsH
MDSNGGFRTFSQALLGWMSKLLAKKMVTFRDLAGVDEAKEELREIIDFLRQSQKSRKLIGRVPKAVLLVGPPGTGKSMLARAIAGEANVSFFSVSGSDFVDIGEREGASRIRDLFGQGKKNTPCIIFIDEIDVVARYAPAGLARGRDDPKQMLTTLLGEMDGFESNEGVILMAATNRPDMLDPSLLRPGRFDRRVVVSRPDVRGREEILRIHTRRIPVAEDVDLTVLARGTPGFSGADLANMVNEAAMSAARQNRKAVMSYDFEIAKDNVLGVERKPIILSDEEKKNVAYYQAGTAVVISMLPHADPLYKVTIIPRGMALGVTSQLPRSDEHTNTREGLESEITILLGGRAAEELFLNHVSTGAGHSIERATELARRMVELGMSALGSLALRKREGDSSTTFDSGEDAATRIDEEVRRLVTAGHHRAKDILSSNPESVVRIAESLVERESLDASDVRLLVFNRFTQDPVSLLLQAVIVPGDRTFEGRLIEAVAAPWYEIIQLLAREPALAFQIEARKWEEIIAGAYKTAGFDEVTLTPRTGDLGRDVIAVKRGIGTVRIIDQVKAYRPGHLVTANDVRALLGVLEGDKASKGFLTTTSDFAPRLVDDILLRPFMPSRLELVNGKALLARLKELAIKRRIT